MEYLERAFDDAKYGWYSKRPYLDCAIQSTVDPDMAPPGKAVWSCFVQYAPYELRESDWDTERERLGDTVQATIESFFPGFGDLVLQREVRTPLDIERTVGLSEGNIFAGEFLAPQMWFMRPAIGWANYRTPIAGYYQCGSGTHPGGCVMGAPGKLAAQAVLKDRERGRLQGRPRRGARRERDGTHGGSGGRGRLRARRSVDLTLTAAQEALRDNARRFVVEVLQPLEVEFERAGGRLPPERGAELRRLAIEAGLAGGELPVPWAAAAGRCSSRCSSTSSTARSPAACGASSRAPTRSSRTPIPTSAGATSSRASGASGSAPTRSPSRTPARTRERSRRPPSATARDWVLNGEKWFVTGPDNTDFMIVQADGRRGRRAAPDAVPRRLRLARRPDVSTTRTTCTPSPIGTRSSCSRTSAFRTRHGSAPSERPTTSSNEWFVAERIHIGARCAGAMERLLTLGVEWATERVQFGSRIIDFQGVSFPLANSAADASAARLLTREAAWLADAGADRKVVHAKASLAKLFASEAAFICADRVIQVFGGRGYMRDNPAERYLRELRVDRIWEGTSEIQRLIIARSLERRGVDRVVG